MAASEHSSSQNLDLANWPVWSNAIGRVGHQSGLDQHRLACRGTSIFQKNFCPHLLDAVSHGDSISLNT